MGTNQECINKTDISYRMAGIFGGEFNVADWQIYERSAKLNSANIFCMMSL